MLDKLGFYFRCNVRDDKDTPLSNKSVRFSGVIKFDTGSDLTMFSAYALQLGDIGKEGFTRWLQTHEKVNGMKGGHIYHRCLFGSKCHGIDDFSDGIDAYAYQVSSFALEFDNGILDLGSVPIMVTFDKRFKTPLLGIDLISLLETKIDGGKLLLEVTTTPEFDDIREKGDNIDCVYMQKRGYYSGKLLNARFLEEERLGKKVGDSGLECL